MVAAVCVEWSKLRSSHYPLEPRYGHSAPSFFNGTTDLVYIYAGRGFDATPFGDVFLFDPVSESCSSELADGSVPAARSFQAAVVAGHRLVVFGGLTADADASTTTADSEALTNSFYLLDILRRPMNWADRMQVIERSPLYRMSSLWPSGWGRGIIPIQKQAISMTRRGQQILYFGGDIGNGVYSRCVFMFDFPKSTWNILFPTRMGASCAESGPPEQDSTYPAARAAAAAAPFSDRDSLYFGGSRASINGSSTEYRVFNDLWIFRTASGEWQNVPPSADSQALPLPREGHTLTRAPSWLSQYPSWILFGGRTCSGNRTACHPGELVPLNDLWLVHIDGRGAAYWRRPQECNSSAASDTPLARSFHTMTLVNDESLVLIGGLGNETVFGDIWRMRWRQRPLEAPARALRGGLPTTPGSLPMYVLIYFPKLSWYAPEQFTVAIDSSLRRGVQEILASSSIPLLDIVLYETASGGGGHGKTLARGTLAQYIMLIGPAFAGRFLSRIQSADLAKYLTSETGTPVRVMGCSSRNALSMNWKQLGDKTAPSSGNALDTAAIASIVTVASAAVAALIVGLLVLFIRRRRRRRRMRRISRNDMTPGRIELGNSSPS
jgi:hypothetical protein